MRYLKNYLKKYFKKNKRFSRPLLADKNKEFPLLQKSKLLLRGNHLFAVVLLRSFVRLINLSRLNIFNIMNVFRTAFPTWIIANILSLVVLFYAGLMYLLTGALMLVSTIIYASIRWGHQPMVIPFEEASLIPHYGPTFWLVVSGGKKQL